MFAIAHNYQAILANDLRNPYTSQSLDDRIEILHNHRSMSSGNRQTKDIIDFIDRLVEACGSSRPAVIQRLLNINYQTAKNYLHGRWPHPEILIRISERTGYSIDWLLTGRGEKLVRSDRPQDIAVPAGQLRAFVREVFEEMMSERRDDLIKSFVLKPEEVLSEKVLEESNTFSDRHR
ncbi:MAG: helix-turn-helix domain-containing protein [Pyrinomonadaceae bacterium]